MTTSYRVTAPMVGLKVRDLAGKVQFNWFYAGVIVDRVVDEASLRRHLDRGWVEAVTEAASAPTPAPASPDVPGEGAGHGDGQPTSPSPGKPSTADPKSAWVDYAVAQGNDREAAEAMTKADLIDQLK